MIMPDLEKCDCTHSIMLHYLKDDSDEYAKCIIVDCSCVEYKAAQVSTPAQKGK